jgi:hypothetical protein
MLVINLPQLPRTFEGYHPPCSQHHILAGCWSPTPSLSLLIGTELPEPTDQHLITRSEAGFDEFQEGLDNFEGLIELASGFLGESFCNIVLSEGPWRNPLFFGLSLKVVVDGMIGS